MQGLECTDLKTAFFSDTRDKLEEGEGTVGGDSTRFSSLRAASSGNGMQKRGFQVLGTEISACEEMILRE